MGKLQNAVFQETLKAHENTSCAPTIPKTLICGAHGMASYGPGFMVFEPILQHFF